MASAPQVPAPDPVHALSLTGELAALWVRAQVASTRRSLAALPGSASILQPAATTKRGSPHQRPCGTNSELGRCPRTLSTGLAHFMHAAMHAAHGPPSPRPAAGSYLISKKTLRNLGRCTGGKCTFRMRASHAFGRHVATTAMSTHAGVHGICLPRLRICAVLCTRASLHHRVPVTHRVTHRMPLIPRPDQVHLARVKSCSHQALLIGCAY